MRDRHVDTRRENRSNAVCLALALCFVSLSSKSDILDNWTTNVVSNNAGMDCIVYANGLYVAFGEYSDYGVILTSEDSQRWTLRSDGISSGISYSTGLSYTGGKLFALGGFGTSGISSDGISWETFGFPSYGGSSAIASGVAFGAGLYVAVSDGHDSSDFGLGRCIAISTDGKVWAAATNAAPLGDVVFGAGRFVAIGVYGSSGFVYRSSNGTNWTQSAIPGGSQISFQSGLFIVPYGPGTNLLSSNGTAWASVQTGLPFSIGKVLFSHGIFLSRAGSILVTSVDGTNWVQYSGQLPGNSSRQPNFATDGTRIVTVGGVFTSLPNTYTGYTYSSDNLFGLQIIRHSPPELVFSGFIGWQCEVDYTSDFPASGVPVWHPLTAFRFLSTSNILFDDSATNLQQRFYRSVLSP
jgi:hypothetical protein